MNEKWQQNNLNKLDHNRPPVSDIWLQFDILSVIQKNKTPTSEKDGVYQQPEPPEGGHEMDRRITRLHSINLRYVLYGYVLYAALP